ncbi:UNVERIFIED_CONTAM: hypothetical protein Sradi_6191100 [Sesamum radiatum]|uniref:Reverse transcriptase zinc-binding domain-containing protein n=1 Tax=Sesamum radiatum TaxID=300843 RepID=A0AAW2K8F7_SESRA
MVSPSSLSAHTRVTDLITAEKEWNTELIRKEFHSYDVECILGIGLDGLEASDTLVWHYDKQGRFNVQSAYQVARMLYWEVGCSTAQPSWRFIWSSKAQPKVLLFAWKAARNALPTQSQLRRRGVHVDEVCSMCWGAQENRSQSLEDWLRTIHIAIRGLEFDYFLTICWLSGWRETNTSSKVMLWMHTILSEWSNAAVVRIALLFRGTSLKDMGLSFLSFSFFLTFIKLHSLFLFHLDL